jgi:hypothetical protein
MGEYTTTCDWTAPGHGFDHETLEAARECMRRYDELRAQGMTDAEAFVALEPQEVAA